MNFYTPPDFLEAFYTLSLNAALINSLYLAIVILWWARADQRLLRQRRPNSELISVADRRQLLKDLRKNYWYFESLPLFVSRSPLRIAMYQSSVPSLAPVLIVLVVQSLPVVSLFVVVWYTAHAAWHVSEALVKHLKQKTPAAIKRVLFTPWF